MGRAYLPHAAAALHSAGEAWHVVRPRGDADRIGLRIAALYSIALGIIPPAVLAWRRLYPDAHVELLECGNSADLANLMALGGADVAVSAAPLHWDEPVRVLGCGRRRPPGRRRTAPRAFGELDQRYRTAAASAQTGC